MKEKYAKGLAFLVGVDKDKLREFVAERTGKCRILVVGDVMLDKYYYSEVARFSSEAPVPVARVMKEKISLGGAANVARNLSQVGCETFITGFVGSDTNCEALLEQFTLGGIEWRGLVYTDRPTTAKVRIMSGHHQMFRVDFEDRSPRDKEYTEKLETYIQQKLNESMDAVIIADYEKGVCTEQICQKIIKYAHAHGVPVIVNPYGTNWLKYANADYVTPNLAKMNKILLEPLLHPDDTQTERAGRYVIRKFKIRNVLATRSEDGISLLGEEASTHIPTKAREVFDSAGAGDTVIAVFATALAGGLKPVEGAYLANLAASVVVGKSGTYAIHKEELLEMLA
ncbi:MAG: D-glycero-beta-D-manno-heptose-7-phosphate kinase [Schwartzia sp.]|nr:D-glycero-beta-D-manno-heptose-7-phosphate kinase [Schwartzia sp. (in: firmicutes)]